MGKKKDTNILILQERNYNTEVKLSKTRKYIKHREREYHQVLTQQGFQLSNLLNQATFNMKGAVHARNFMEYRCKELEIALQNSSINMQHSSNELVAIKSQLKEAKKDFELSQKAYNDMRVAVKSNEPLKKKLVEKEKELAEFKSSYVSKDCKCKEYVKQQKMDYEALKQKHAEKVKQYNDSKNSFESSKKESSYNKKQSASILQERQQQINDLIQQVNSLNDFKFNSIKKSDHEKVLQEYNKLKVEHSELQLSINEAKQINSVAAEPSNSNYSHE